MTPQKLEGFLDLPDFLFRFFHGLYSSGSQKNEVYLSLILKILRFISYRTGFCNLFSRPNPAIEHVQIVWLMLGRVTGGAPSAEESGLHILSIRFILSKRLGYGDRITPPGFRFRLTGESHTHYNPINQEGFFVSVETPIPHLGSRSVSIYAVRMGMEISAPYVKLLEIVDKII